MLARVYGLRLHLYLPLIKGKLLINNYTPRALKAHGPSEQIPGLFALFDLSGVFFFCFFSKPVHRLLPLTCISYRGNPAGAAVMLRGDTADDRASIPRSRSWRCRGAQRPSPPRSTRADGAGGAAARSCVPRDTPPSRNGDAARHRAGMAAAPANPCPPKADIVLLTRKPSHV